MKILLLSNIIRDNVKDGKLEAGRYNVAYEGIMSCMAEYANYDGEKWLDAMDWDDRAMTVFVRDSDCIS